MTKQQLYLLIFILILPSMSYAQEDTWTTKADMPTARTCQTSVVNGKIYAIGGLAHWYDGPVLSTVEEYDPVTDTWAKKSDMPTARYELSTNAVNGRIYAIGGFNRILFNINLLEDSTYLTELDNAEISESLRQEFETSGISLSQNATVLIENKSYHWNITDSQNTYQLRRQWDRIFIFTDSDVTEVVEEYDPITDTWMKKSDIPTPRSAHSADVVNGKIYVIGGWDGHTELSTVEEYDPATDTWTQKTNMPTARDDFSTGVVNGKIYAIGGTVVGEIWEGVPVFLSSVEEYDPVTDTWTQKANMPTARDDFSASTVNGKIYVIGGWEGTTFLPTIEEYDPVTGRWTEKANMPTAIPFLSTSAVNGYIYAIGGLNFSFNGVQDVEEYNTGYGIRVSRISPQEGRVNGGESVAIFGKDFPSDVIVTIGGNPLTELRVTDSLITGIIPPGKEGEWNVLISAPSIDFKVFAGKFFYFPLSGIVVRTVSPDNGKQSGGDVGSITGIGFLSGARVTIGGSPASDIVVNPTLITFTIPPGTEGAKDVVVINPDGEKGTLRDGYTYNPFPVIEKIKPDYGGPLAGGTEITITGNHFIQGVVVTIGDERIQRLDFFSPTELRLNTPAGTAGPKDVSVLNPDEQEAVLKEGFTYNPAPIIVNVSPNIGSLEGETEITITGTGFLRGVNVLVGGAKASRWIKTPTKIGAKTPPSTPGPKDVVVINPDGQEATLEAGFTYNPAPVITKVVPDNGRLAGGTKITVQGSGFLPKARVLIDTGGRTFVMASSIQVISPSIITAVTPSGEPGPKDVVVRNPDRQEIVLQGGFTYNPMPKINDISPNHGPVSGGTKIIIRGTGFLQGAKVVVGKRPGTAQVQDESTIEAVTPQNPQGVFDVRVINPDTQEAVKYKGFVSVGEVAYNYPNPFRASQGTTFRYITNERVDLIKVQIFNLRGAPIGVVGQSGSNEVRWYDASVHAGLYVYLMEVKLENGKVKKFKRMLEVYK